MKAANSTRRRGRTPMAEINVTPMVDVMLVLLVIFMVTAPLLNAGVPVNLPDSHAKPLGQSVNPLDLALTRDGKLYLGGVELGLAALPAKLAEVPRGADGNLPLVSLRADRSLDYGRVMAVMGELNHAGFAAISLVTTSGAPAPQPALTPAAAVSRSSAAAP